MLRQEGEADVDVRQRVALDQAAQSKRQRVAAPLDQEQAEAVVRIQPLRSFGDVAMCALEVAHATVTNEPQPGGLIDEAQNERRVFRG